MQLHELITMYAREGACVCLYECLSMVMAMALLEGLIEECVQEANNINDYGKKSHLGMH